LLWCGSEENVGRFDVAMHDAALVHGMERIGDLDEVMPNLRLLEVAPLSSLLFQQQRNVSAFGQFEDEVEVVVVEIGMEVLNDVRVWGQRLENVCFVDHFAPSVAVHLEDGYFFHGDQLARASTARAVHFAVLATTDHAQ
jgi:hypothetical protein